MDSAYLNDDLVAIRDQTRRFIGEEVAPNGEEWEAAGMVPRETLKQMGEIGFFGLRVPEEHGGVGFGARASAVFAEELGRSTFGGFAATVLVHTDMATPHLLGAGSEAQLAKYLPGILSGETITAIGVSEPDAGSDVAAMRTSAVADGDGFRLNGSKMFITNGVHGNLVFVAARTDNLAKAHRGISMFIVEAGTEGFGVGRKLDKLGWRSSDTAELVFSDCWIPGENLLGELNRGFYAIMSNFQNERLVLAGLAIGEARKAIELTLEHTQHRKAFEGVLYDKQAIRHRLGMLQAKVTAGREMLYRTAWLMERGEAVKEVSMLKAYCGELVNEVTYACLQFHGGLGFIAETPIERLYRDSRIASIGGGATEVMLEEVAKRSYP